MVHWGWILKPPKGKGIFLGVVTINKNLVS